MTALERALQHAERAVFALRLAAEGKDCEDNLTEALRRLDEAETLTEAELRKAVGV